MYIQQMTPRLLNVQCNMPMTCGVSATAEPLVTY